MSTAAQIEDNQADDKQRFAHLKSNASYAELPGVDQAMWPGDVDLDLDVSGYNDRYLKMPFPPPGTMYILYLVSCWNTAGGAVFIMFPLFNHDFGILNVIIFLIYNMPFIAIGIFIFRRFRNEPALIYNRQAQVIHKMQYGLVMHIPWRDVRPFTRFTIYREVILFSPIPTIIRNSPNNRVARSFLRIKDPLFVGGCRLQRSDTVDVERNMQRFEFIRRYMEHGISAVKPPPDVTPKKPIYSDIKRARAEGLTFYRLFMECVYWFALGPLVDLWVKWLHSKAVWPEEVKRLLEPGADLSEFDTTPVHPHPNVYYRYGMTGYYLCDEHGNEIPW